MKKSISSFLNFLVLTLCLAFTATPLCAKSENWYFNTASAADSAFVRGRLDNGIAYFIIPNKNSGNYVAISMLAATGSVDELPSQRGYAHMLEHLVFSSTDENGRSIDKRLADAGLRFGYDVNAATSFDYTSFDILEVSNTSYKALNASFEALASICRGLNISSNALEHEKDVICNEIDEKDEDLIQQTLNTIFLPGTAYHERNIIGNRRSVRAATLDGIMDFYRSNLQRAEKAIVVVGNIDPSLALLYIKNHFNNVDKCQPSRKASAKLEFITHKPFDISAIGNDDTENFNVRSLIITDKHPRRERLSEKQRHSDRLAICGQILIENALMSMIAGGELPRLSQYNLDYNPIQSLNAPYALDIILLSTPENWADISATLSGLYSRWAADGISKEEYDNIRFALHHYMKNYKFFTTISNSTLMELFTKALISGAEFMLDEATIAKEINLAMQLTHDELNQYVRRTFKPENIFFLVTTSSNDLPDAATLSASVAQGRKNKHDDSKINMALTDSILSSKAAELRSIAAKISAPKSRKFAPRPWEADENKVDDCRLIEIPRKNGNATKVYLINDRFNDGHLCIYAFRPGGYAHIVDSLSRKHPERPIDKLWVDASLTEYFPYFFDWGRIASPDLTVYGQNRNMSLNTDCMLTSSIISAEGHIEDADMMLATFDELFRRGVKKNDKLFEKNRSELISQLLQLYSSPNIKVADAALKQHYGNNPVFGSGNPEDLSQVDAKIATEACSLAYNDGRSFSYILYGDFDPANPNDSTVKLVHSFISSLPDEPTSTIADLGDVPLPEFNKANADTTLKAEPNNSGAEANALFHQSRCAKIKPAYFAEIFQTIFEKQLLNKLRFEGNAKVYSISVDYDYDYDRLMAIFNINCVCLPENIQAVEDIVDRTFKGEFLNEYFPDNNYKAYTNEFVDILTSVYEQQCQKLLSRGFVADLLIMQTLFHVRNPREPALALFNVPEINSNLASFLSGLSTAAKQIANATVHTVRLLPPER